MWRTRSDDIRDRPVSLDAKPHSAFLLTTQCEGLPLLLLFYLSHVNTIRRSNHTCHPWNIRIGVPFCTIHTRTPGSTLALLNGNQARNPLIANLHLRRLWMGILRYVSGNIKVLPLLPLHLCPKSSLFSATVIDSTKFTTSIITVLLYDTDSAYQWSDDVDKSSEQARTYAAVWSPSDTWTR
jgi:hypothetical protein